MKVSVNWIKQFVDFELPPIDVLVQKIGEQLGAVEEVVNFGAKYKGAVIVKVVHSWKHENSDHLNVCLVDDGGITPDVNRNENGLVQVVCGASNVREGLLAVWLPPGATVPDSYDADPFVLGSRELRGVMSNGMLASAKELALGDSHEGILEVDADKTAGQLFADAYELNDYIIDIENKMFTHRPDCFGQLGVVREISGILGHAFVSPSWYTENPVFGSPEVVLPLEVENKLPELVPRFTAITMSGVTVAPSPLWIQTYLIRAGVRPINNVVDITNIFMLETGQPLHAYDYDKVKSLSSSDVPTLVIRKPQPNETVRLLSGKEIAPRSEAVLIATDRQAIAIGGVMGGSETEVDETTKNIILECANFDMYNIRRTAMVHGLFTDAVTRFNKGQSPKQNLAVLAKIVTEIQQLLGAKVAGQLIDDNHAGKVPVVVRTSADFVNTRLGLDMGAEDITALLQNVEFEVAGGVENSLQITVPFWRTDIKIPEDIVEEVGRLYGFDKLKLELPQASIAPVQKNVLLATKTKIRDVLAGAGANEVMTYSFVHGDLLQKVGQDKDLAYKLSNALSPDLQYYRMSLTPSLLDKVHLNIKTGYDNFALFEIGKTHVIGQYDENDGNLPLEPNRVALVIARSEKAASKDMGAPYYFAKKYALEMLSAFGISEKHVTFVRNSNIQGNTNDSAATSAPYHPDRTCSVAVQYPSKLVTVGFIGEFTNKTRKNLKLPAFSAGFEFDIDELLDWENTYSPLSKFPKVTQDITFRISSAVTYRKLSDLIDSIITDSKPEHTSAHISTLGIYQREGDDHINITFRISLVSYEKTMRDEELSKLLNIVAGHALQSVSAERV